LIQYVKLSNPNIPVADIFILPFPYIKEFQLQFTATWQYKIGISVIYSAVIHNMEL
jgi:hypothetical protein